MIEIKRTPPAPEYEPLFAVVPGGDDLPGNGQDRAVVAARTSFTPAEGLTYVHLVRTQGINHAIDWLLETGLEPGGADTFRRALGMTEDQSQQILGVLLDRVLGGPSRPKSSD